MNNPYIFVIYDGIKNSVFQGQVLTPLAERARQHPHRPVWLISYESKNFNHAEVEYLIPSELNITLKILTRLPFLGTASLWYGVSQLRTVLPSFSSYELVARGPIAGWLCNKAASSKCISLLIQARGLLAEEYKYTHQHKKMFGATLFHTLRSRQLEHIEKQAYASLLSATPFPIHIEAVSLALGSYLHTHFGTPEKLVTIAQQDIPKEIDHKKRAYWKNEVRNALTIPMDAQVYCYNGSAKPWQCPELVATHFKHTLTKDPTAHLLVLTHDTRVFEKIITHERIPANRVHILSVPHHQIYSYLSAANVGLLFREQHIVNWVSRPTKALEYSSAGLKIEHNNTIAYLSENNQNQI